MPQHNHRRIVYPGPSSSRWRIACTCGWSGQVDLSSEPRRATDDDIRAELNRQFVDHVPATERQTYLLVDRRPGHEGCFLMPEGIPCALNGWAENDGTYVGTVAGNEGLALPVGEVRTADGRVFRLVES